jgi:hypothetical protein
VKPSFSLVFAALLALSLVGKLAANTATPDADPALFNAAGAAALRAAGFAPVEERRPFGTILRARRGPCRLLLGEYDPHGTFDALYRELAAPIGPLRFAWRGKVYARVPKVRALGGFYLWRELRRIRIQAPRAPLAAWAASPGCDPASIDWRRLASLPS